MIGLDQKDTMNDLEFLQEIFSDRHLDYAILHGWEAIIRGIKSDLDIIVSPDSLIGIEKKLMLHPQCRIIQLFQHEATSFYFVVERSYASGKKVIALDIATDYRAKGQIFYSSRELLNHKRKWHGLYVASYESEFKYLMIKRVLKGDINSHQFQILKYIYDKLGNKSYNLVKDIFDGRTAKKVHNFVVDNKIEALHNSLPGMKKVLLWHNFKKCPFCSIQYYVNEIKRVFRRFFHPTGIIISVLGPDGAGKSTLIRNLRKELSPVFRRGSVYHFRPNIFRKKSSESIVTNPHKNSPRTFLFSIVKLVYYYLDFLLGYLFQIKPGLIKSTLIIFDRYFDDLWVDPKRYRYGGPKSLIRFFQKIVPHPDIYFILDAPVDLLIQRKQELSSDILEVQRKKYADLAGLLPNAFILEGSVSSEELTIMCRDIIFDYLHQRYLQRREIIFKENLNKNGDLDWISTIVNR